MPKPSNKQTKATQDPVPPADASAPRTPPVSPALEAVEPKVTLTVKDFTHALVDALITRGVITSTETPAPAEPRPDGHAEPKKEIRRASKLAFKTVDEVYVARVLDDLTDHSVYRWDSASSKYKIVSSIPPPELDELDENVFVAQRRVGEHERETLSAHR